jgi:hypothetical protein
VKNLSVPAAPWLCLEKNAEEDETVVEAEHQSIVGQSTCLVTKLFLEGSNLVRELAKFFSDPGIEHWEHVEKFAGCLKDNEHDIRLTHMKPKEMWMMSSVCRDCGMDKESWHRASGNLHTVGGVTANWLHNAQSNVTLSVMEAKCQSMSKASQETLFSQMLIREIVCCFCPVVVLEDNTGTLFLDENQQVGRCLPSFCQRAAS